MDRLNELKKGAKQLPQTDPEENTREIQLSDIETAIPDYEPVKNNDALNEFFDRVKVVKNNIHQISEAAKLITVTSQEVMLASAADKETKASHTIDETILRADKTAKSTKEMIQRMQQEARDDSSTKKKGKMSTTDKQLRLNTVLALTRKFIATMKQYQLVQTEHKKSIKKKITRRLRIMNPGATDEDADAVIRSGGNSATLLQEVILKGSASDVIQNAYYHAEGKYQDVLDLEASMTELNQMFQDLSLLTMNQGDLLDRVESQVIEANDQISQGNNHITTAIEYLKELQQRRCCLAIILLIIIGIAVGVGVAGGLHKFG